ncbi:DUF3857 domain-containing protein [Pedobacter metabolipauper]|uniref:Transglutaminase superfamily protein n=1 Tax=Pedobacter metabolipauper TaxID=425513 RepID=A0A4R6T125_9SPHI|nr:DUF3857 domain-containing protein [Pedobacter metabolipauper]TDQ12097.1 transglutaminase superfamily protein [Pedobacter metabolipauper]
MIRNLIFLLVIFLGTPGFSQVQINYRTDNIPAELKNRANAVIRNMETTVDMRSPENVIITVKKVMTIFNDNGNKKGALVLFYDKNTAIKSVRGQTFNSFGMATGKFSLSDFIDQSAVDDGTLYGDYRVKAYLFNPISYPYTISYEYEIRNKQNLVIPDWYTNPDADVSVEKSSYTFISKPEDKVRIKEYNFKGNPEILKSEKFSSYTWKVQNISAYKPEPYAPVEDKYLAHVKIAPEQFTYYGHKGSYTNWEELGKWFYNDLIKTRQKLSPQTIQEVTELVKGISDDKEKARKIYDYVQKKTRYISVQIGIGGFQPFEAEEVHRSGYGDCKGLVNYTQSLLKAAGINSYYCLVYGSRTKQSFEPDFANIEGNHIILCIPSKTDTTWLECTSQESPFGYLGGFTDDRTVLACTENGGILLKTPTLTTQQNLLKRNAELTIDQEGNVTGKIKTDFSGSQYDNYAYLTHKSYTDQLKALKDEYDIDNINFSDFKLVQKKDDNPKATETVNLSIQKFASKTSSRVYLVPNAFNKSGTISELKNRTLPLYINRGYTDEDEIIYTIPEGYTIEIKPKDQEIRSPFGIYAVSIKQNGSKLYYTRKISINQGTYAPEKYAEYATFINRINQADHDKIVFKLN